MEQGRKRKERTGRYEWSVQLPKRRRKTTKAVSAGRWRCCVIWMSIREKYKKNAISYHRGTERRVVSSNLTSAAQQVEKSHVKWFVVRMEVGGNKSHFHPVRRLLGNWVYMHVCSPVFRSFLCSSRQIVSVIDKQQRAIRPLGGCIHRQTAIYTEIQ